eukprot:scaffold124462_cov72-Phaeocystis_antarctica.AAC.1
MCPTQGCTRCTTPQSGVRTWSTCPWPRRAPRAHRCARASPARGARARPPSPPRTHLCGKQGGSDLGQLALRRPLSGQIVPQAALSLGQPRPISRLGRAGRPYRLVFSHRDARARLSPLPLSAASRSSLDLRFTSALRSRSSRRFSLTSKRFSSESHVLSASASTWGQCWG